MAKSTLITALETLLLSKVGIDWIGIVTVMLSGPPIVSTEVIGVWDCPKSGMSGQNQWYVQALGNMNEQDSNENG